MPILKDEAQVLRIYEQGNTSLVAVMLGRRLGQFRVHAKGARRWPRKGFEGGLDLLVRGEVLVYPRSGDSLWLFKEWDERVRPNLGRSLAQLRAASYLCELTEALTRQRAGALDDERAVRVPERATAALHDLLAAAADALDGRLPAGPVLLSFTLRALELEGVLPSLTACAQCGKNLLSTNAPLWLNGLSLRCRACIAAEMVKPEGEPPGRGTWLSPEAHRALLHIYRSGKFVRLSPAAAEQLARAMILLVHGALEHDLRTLLGAARWVRMMAPRAGKK